MFHNKILKQYYFYFNGNLFLYLLFPGRTSHYSLHDSSRIYLPEELNVKKMHGMFIDLYKDNGIKVSYEYYRNIFNGDFNIAFGYPRTDTCSTCDTYKVKIDALNADLHSSTGLEKLTALKKDLYNLEIEKKLHLCKPQVFYTRKRAARLHAKDAAHLTEAICLDYGKKLSVPNIQTNDVYYKRQLTVCAFNVHVLNSRKSIFYLYAETQGKKGSDDVCEMV